MSHVKPSERGAALLSVLLMVAVLAVIAATTLDRLTLSSKLAANGNALAQARMFTYAAEAIAAARIEDLIARDAAQTTLAGDWMGKPQSIPIPIGSATATLRDAGNCFNLNSLVTESEGRYLANATGMAQLVSLLIALGTDENSARAVAAAAADWADSDVTPVANGVEDEGYRVATTPYLVANRPYAHPSELRAVKGVTPALYAKVQDWICALPDFVMSPLNVNTLLPEQAPLLAMLFAPGQMSLATARSYLAKRPSNGYGSLIRFWAAPELVALGPSPLVQGQVKLTSNYFLLNTQVSFGELELAGQSMIVASPAPARVIWRSWGEEGVTLVITRFPVTDVDDPAVFRVSEGIWHDAGQLSKFVHSVNDATVMALLAPEHVRCSWFSFPDLEARQAVGVAKLRATEQSLGLVHSSAGQDFDGAIATATIAPEVMQSGLNSLAARDLNPDIVLPLALVFNAPSEGISKAEFDGVAVLRGPGFAIPDEAFLRNIFIGASPTDNVDAESLRSMLLNASVAPVLNLREGIFAKRERTVWTSAEQRSWIKRLLGVIVLITIFITLATLAKYWSAARAENETALAAAQKIDPTIRDIDQAESALASSLDRRGIVHSGFTPLSAALWRSVKASPNVSVRELRFTRDGILTAVLAAPTADNLNKTLVTIQQDGFRITATPRQDASGSMLVDLTVRMP